MNVPVSNCSSGTCRCPDLITIKNCIQQGFVLVIIHKYITLIHLINIPLHVFFIITDIKSSSKINNAKTCTNGCMDLPVNKLGLSQNFKHTCQV